MSTSQFLLSGWNWHPVVIGLCLAMLFVYGMATRMVFCARTCFFVSGVLLLFLTLASPLNTLADGYLFSAHMLQHMLLLLIVPMLLLKGLPAGQTFAWRKLPKINLPAVAGWLGGVGAMWIWHERTLCDLATRSETMRAVQTVSLLALGTMFWWPILGPDPRRHIPPLTGVVYLFSACIACSVLGIFITFSPLGAVCPVFLQPPDHPAILNLVRQGWGFSLARDQQMGGLMMWVPGCAIYLSGVMAMLARWYRTPETSLTFANQTDAKSASELFIARLKTNKP